MRYLSLFSGIEAATVAWHPLGWEPVAFSEIEPFPCALLQHRYPNVPNLGDVTKITEEQVKQLGPIDLVVFGAPCFVAGTKVITDNRYADIESLQVGEKVLTHENRYRTILKTGFDVSETIIVKAQGITPTETTKEHPYYVRTMSRKWDSKRKSGQREFTEPYWKAAGELTKKDFIALPILQEESNSYELTPDECYVLGRYLADGHTRKDYRTTEGRFNDRYWTLILSIGEDKLEDFRASHGLKFNTRPHTASTVRCTFNSKRLVQLAECLCGSGAANKVIGANILSLPKHLLKRFLAGYLSGDGSCKEGVHRATTISLPLAQTLNLAIAKAYRVNSSVHTTSRPTTCTIEGRVVNQKDTHTVAFREGMKSQSKATVIGEYIWLPVKEVLNSGRTQVVYNLEVEEDNSYTANNAVVHNCQDLSIAGKQRGFRDEDGNTTRSGLFFDALRIFNYARQHGNARFALWENVPGAFSSSKGRDFAEVVGAMAGLSHVDVPKNGWGSEGAAVGDNGLLEWACLDSQWRQLAQRRNRVFALLDTGDWASRPPILLERESLRGNTPPSRETRQETTGNATEGTFECSGIGEYKPSSSSSSPLRRTGADLGNGCEALITRPSVTYRDTAQCLNAGAMGRIDYETETLILAFHHNAQPDQMKFEEHTTAPLTCSQGAAVAFAQNTRDEVRYINGVMTPELQVRRLTPKECERLQGFDDLYTLTPFRGKPSADGNRYKALGNSMAVPVMRYIGEQIDQALCYQNSVEDLL